MTHCGPKWQKKLAAKWLKMVGIIPNAPPRHWLWMTHCSTSPPPEAHQPDGVAIADQHTTYWLPGHHPTE